MNCQDCGSEGAFVHLTEIVGDEVRSIWLCPTCSRSRQEKGVGPSDSNAEFKNDSESLAAFLGEGSPGSEASDQDQGVGVCPACDYRLDRWRLTNLLGCPRCYQAFSEFLVPHLNRFHGNASHFGKFPTQYSDDSNNLSSLKRIRLALDKAVAREDFEEAARLRDSLLQLKSGKGRDS
jgi:protein arginine kinase activator